MAQVIFNNEETTTATPYYSATNTISSEEKMLNIFFDARGEELKRIEKECAGRILELDEHIKPLVKKLKELNKEQEKLNIPLTKVEWVCNRNRQEEICTSETCEKLNKLSNMICDERQRLKDKRAEISSLLELCDTFAQKKEILTSYEVLNELGTMSDVKLYKEKIEDILHQKLFRI